MNSKRIALLITCLLVTTLCAPALAQDISPTTGLPTDQPYRPVLLQTNNYMASRPQWSLADADIVYEAIIYGPSHTRYLALYNDVHPDIAGPIRSSRFYWLSLREMWDAPLFFFGGPDGPGISIYDYSKRLGTDSVFLLDGTRGGAPGYLTRHPGRENPHNAVVDVASWVANEWPQNEDGTPYEPRLPGLSFADPPSRNARDTAIAVDVIYHEEYAAQYTFDDTARHYVRYYDGVPQQDVDGKAVTAENIIVQYVPLSFFNDRMNSPVMYMTGAYPIDAFIDGTHIRGVWIRETESDVIRYLDGNGEPLVLLPGKTFIQIYPTDRQIRYQSRYAEWITSDASPYAATVDQADP